MRSKTSLRTGLSTTLAGLILLGHAPAQAQDTPPASPPATEAAPAQTDQAITNVTVTGKKPQNRIDRQVYDNKDQIDSTSGTAADALSKVPSVNVDTQGNVTLRGNSNVQVYVDGKPSAMMQGDNRAGALQSMASSDIDSIEVMTNPGAAFSSEGSGGIINLVMRKNRKPGNTGAINANVGEDRYNAAITGARNAGKYTISGGLNVRHDTRPGNNGSVLQRLDSDGNVVSRTDQVGQTTGTNDNVSGNAGYDYTLSDKDSIGIQVNASHRENDSTGDSTYAIYDPAGAALSRYDRHSVSEGQRDETGLGLRWDHTGNLAGETLKTDLRLSRSIGGSTSNSQNIYSLGGTNSTDVRTNNSDTRNAVLSVDYNRPIGQALLTTGIQITRDDNSFNNIATGAGSAGLSNIFSYEQTISAAYVTWQQGLGEKWTVQGGLRAEALDLDTDAISSNTTSHIAYTKLSPSAFATYALSDSQKLRFSYSHRLQRPNPQDLNPFRVYQDPTNVSQGNSDLKPQETDSFEAGYEVTGKFNYQLRGYYRKTTDTITSYSFFEPATTPGGSPVLVTTKRNFGDGEAGGLEFNLQGKLTPKLSINANGNLAYNKLTTDIGGTQDGSTLSGRIMLDYAATLKDRIQLMYFSSGKQLTGQGYRAPFSSGNLSYRHQYTPKAALVVNVQDPFHSGKFKQITDTSSVYSESYGSRQGPTIMIGLSYTLGGPSSSQQNPWDGQRRGHGGGWGGPGGGPM
ncbi:TonB-dependent receptor domain-containing protein [Asticcacaulis sp. AC466]|uniref:TonB-dependent receptor domain-containing protein n=1 Tax=Asticcacaulis sp. AC466 TaxID=1282362 RepID=UPI0004253D01|nr:TonB-dependent receptor [Asticcacaulis sp. AC466]